MPMNGNVSETTIDFRQIELHGGEYADARILFSAPEGGTVPRGTVLSRDAGGDLAPYDGTSAPIAVAVAAVVASAAGSVPARVLVAGSVVRERLVDAAGAAVTDAVVDWLQSVRINAVETRY